VNGSEARRIAKKYSGRFCDLARGCPRYTRLLVLHLRCTRFLVPALALAAFAAGWFFVFWARQGPGGIGRGDVFWFLAAVGALIVAESRFFCLGGIVVTGGEKDGSYILLVDGMRFNLSGEDLPFQTRVYFAGRSCYMVILVDEKNGKIVARDTLNLIDGGRDEVAIDIPGTGRNE